MADNFLERQYDDYVRQNEQRNRRQRLLWQRRLRAYIAAQKSKNDPLTPNEDPATNP